ncbi:MAG: hypothetical protein ABH827_05985 [bacterium]
MKKIIPLFILLTILNTANLNCFELPPKKSILSINFKLTGKKRIIQHRSTNAPTKFSINLNPKKLLRIKNPKTIPNCPDKNIVLVEHFFNNYKKSFIIDKAYHTAYLYTKLICTSINIDSEMLFFDQENKCLVLTMELNEKALIEALKNCSNLLNHNQKSSHILKPLYNKLKKIAESLLKEKKKSRNNNSNFNKRDK